MMQLAQPSTRFRQIYGLFALVILSVPLFAMHFTPEVDWGIVDFGLFALMLLIQGLALEFYLRIPMSRMVRATAIAISVAVFVFVWAMLAVG